MQKLVVETMENIYGIKKLIVHVDNSNALGQCIIYSKNGTFKTSFSRCLYEVAHGNTDSIKDRITDTSAVIDLKIVDGNKEVDDLENKFIVFSRDIYEQYPKKITDYSMELETLMVIPSDRDFIYDLIIGDLEEPLLELEHFAKKIGLNFNKTLEFLSDEEIGKLDNVINILNGIDSAPEIEISNINLKKIFQKPYDIIDDKNFQEKISNYINLFNKRIKEELFDKEFDENNCLIFLENIKKTNFCNKDKKRGVVLLGKEYYNYLEVEDLFYKTIEKVSMEPELLEQNKELLKCIGTSNEAENLKNEIIVNPLLIQELSLGRKNILNIVLKASGVQTKYWLEILEKTKIELNKVLLQVKNKKSIFEKAIEIYKKRFHPIFEIKIENKQESMLGLEIPSVLFKHKSNQNYTLDEEKIYSILSSGERTAFNIIKFIIEYLSNKDNNPIIILDDIVETFDYSNRYAFLEYINDMVKSGVVVIVLTHNFEFYQNVKRRVPELKRLGATVNSSGTVMIQQNKNLNRDIEKILEINNEQSIIFAIPFLREGKIILKQDIETLNSCLHYNEKTVTLNIDEILNCFPTRPTLDVDGNKLYLDLLKEIATEIKTLDDFDLVKKVILSICCRVFLEKKIIGNDFNILQGINDYQFAQLREKYSNKLTNEIKDLMDRIQLTTPEFIHGNAFMYEPLVDIDGFYLVEIYNDVISFDSNKIWK